MKQDYCKENNLEYIEDKFDYYLDNSADCDTIKYEVRFIYEFGELLDLVELVDSQEETILKVKGIIAKDAQVHSNRAMLFDFIRELWDIAYNHGFHDGQVDLGLTLADME